MLVYTSWWPRVALLRLRGCGSWSCMQPTAHECVFWCCCGCGLQPHWSTAKELLVRSDGKVRQLADHGEINMDNPATLTDFIRRTVSVRPEHRPEASKRLRGHTPAASH